MIFKAGKKLFINLMKNNDEKRLKGLKTFGNINIRSDVQYVDDGLVEHRLDIIYPAENSNGMVILYVHGGSYIYGYKEYSSIFTSCFASNGFTVIAMNYRLANHKENIGVVEQVQDVFACLDFLEKNRIYYKLDTDKFAIMGDSAGGHLSLITNILFNNPEYREFFGIKEVPDLKVKCYSLDSPMYDMNILLKNGRKLLNKSLLRDIFTNNYKDEEYLTKLSPRYYFNKNVQLDPIFVNTSLHDDFSFQSHLLKTECDKLGIPLKYYKCESPDKNIGHVYNHFVFDKEGKVCNDMIIDFIKEHIKD